MLGRVEAAFLSLRAVVGPPFKLAFRSEMSGREHLPRSGSAILASNHASFLDPILIGVHVRRPVRFLVSREFYADWRLNAVLRWLGTIPVGGDAGMVRSFRLIAELVRRGELIGIFPEGGISRDGTMRPFRSGAAVIALRMGIPVVPVHVRGTFEALPRYARWPRLVPLTLRIGQPIAVAARKDPSRDAIDGLTTTIRSAIETLAR